MRIRFSPLGSRSSSLSAAREIIKMNGSKLERNKYGVNWIRFRSDFQNFFALARAEGERDEEEEKNAALADCSSITANSRAIQFPICLRLQCEMRLNP